MSIKSIHNLIMKEIREEGYYWCKEKAEKWVIARFVADVWFRIGKYESFEDDHFLEIDENRITREPTFQRFDYYSRLVKKANEQLEQDLKGSDLYIKMPPPDELPNPENRGSKGDKLFGLL